MTADFGPEYEVPRPTWRRVWEFTDRHDARGNHTVIHEIRADSDAAFSTTYSHRLVIKGHAQDAESAWSPMSSDPDVNTFVTAGHYAVAKQFGDEPHLFKFVLWKIQVLG